MDIRKVLKNLSEEEIMVISACLHHCAVMGKEERKQFIIDYGTKTDKGITLLMKKICEK